MSHDRIERRIRRYIEKMPSLSTTVIKVIEICDSPNTSPNDLNRIISLDPVLTGQVIRLVNSAYYAVAHRVTSLTRAIIMLGINTVKNLALSTAILKGIESRGVESGLSMDVFWEHSIRVGVGARYLAQMKNIDKAGLEEYFVAGLLHDLGKIPLSNCFPSGYELVMKTAFQEKLNLLDVEFEAFETDHCQVGRMIAEKWRLNKALSESIIYHHFPESGEVTHHSLVNLVAMSNMFDNMIVADALESTIPVNDRLMDLTVRAGLNPDVVLGMGQAVALETQKAKAFLNVARTR